MSKDRADIKILLLGFRSDPARSADDLAGFSRSTGLSPRQFRTVSVVETSPEASMLDGVDGIMVGGSTWSVFEDVPNLTAAKGLLREARRRGLPIFGVCFGHQLIAASFGGEVVRDEPGEEFGSYDITLSEAGENDPLLSGLPSVFSAICGHHDRVSRMPDGAVMLASSELCGIHAIRFPDEPIYGVQFHPEHTAESFRRVMGTVGRKYFSDDEKVDAIIGRIVNAPLAGEVPARFVDRIILGR
jgi:GMP synthase (glutamine-hydrolysing)